MSIRTADCRVPDLKTPNLAASVVRGEHTPTVSGVHGTPNGVGSNVAIVSDNAHPFTCSVESDQIRQAVVLIQGPQVIAGAGNVCPVVECISSPEIA